MRHMERALVPLLDVTIATMICLFSSPSEHTGRMPSGIPVDVVSISESDEAPSAETVNPDRMVIIQVSANAISLAGHKHEVEFGPHLVELVKGMCEADSHLLVVCQEGGGDRVLAVVKLLHNAGLEPLVVIEDGR